MQFSFRIIVFLIALASCQSVWAQGQSLQFKVIPGVNNITLGKINSITHDKYGYLWLSDQTNRCIIRYDGNKMFRYQNSALDSNSLGGYYPECLYADTAGNIWIGFYGTGLDKFDPHTNTFTHYRHNKNDPNSLPNDTISAILMEGDKMWLGTNGGLIQFDQKTNRFTSFKHDPKDPKSLSWNAVRSLYLDSNKDLWIGTGLIWSNTGKGGLNKFNRSTNNFTRYVHDPRDSSSLAENNVRCIFEDSYGNFWLGTGGVGIQSLDRKTGKFTHYPFNPARPDLLSRSKPRSIYDNVTFIVEDATRKLWFGTYAGGMVRYDPGTKKTERIDNGMIGRGGVNDTTGWAAHALSDGTVWIGTELNNFFKVDVTQTKLPFISTAVYNYGKVLQEGDIFWQGVDNGFFRKNLKTGTSKFYDVYNLDAKPITRTPVFDFLRDHNGVFWVNSNAGLFRLNETTDQLERLILDSNAASQPNTIAIIEDSKNRLWCTSFSGLYLISADRTRVRKFGFDPFNENSPSSDVPVEVLELGDEEFLIVFANNGGMCRYSLKTDSWTRYHYGLTCYQLKRDRTGEIWVASQGGLFRYDKAQKQFMDITQDGKVAPLGEMIAMVVDGKNNIWFSSIKMLYRLNAARDQIIEFGEYFLADGLHDFRYGAAGFVGNKIYFGSDDGYYLFNPDSIRLDLLSGKINFSGFWLNSKKLSPSTEGPLLRPIQSTSALDLKYNHNTFSFSASLINFKYAHTDFEYQLEPYDGQWRTAQHEERIQYYNLHPGDYVLKIRSSTSDGGWIGKEIQISIRPPWWRNNWAYLVYSILTLGLIYVFARYQRRRIREQERMRNSQRELEQAKEIEKAYHQLKATQAQLVQAEKMASLGELTAGIAHEIQNPLNFVTNFSDVNTELIADLKESMKNGGTDSDELLSALEENEKKINHHGKRADSIVKSMLQHSRTNIGIKEPTDINALAEEYLRLAFHGMRAKDKEFQAAFECIPDPSVGKVNVVSQDMGRVVLNLINNAFYAVHERAKSKPANYQPKVTLRTKRYNNKVSITISDNGKGMKSELVNKIFQPFFTTKPTGVGTGLGLSLSYDIVKAHGGEIHVESTEGEGSTFTIILPA